MRSQTSVNPLSFSLNESENCNLANNGLTLSRICRWYDMFPILIRRQDFLSFKAILLSSVSQLSCRKLRTL